MYRSRRGIFFLKEEICLVELEKKFCSRRMIGGQASSPSLPKERSKLGQSAKGQKSRKFRAIGYRGQRSSPGNGGDGGEKGEEPPIRGQLLNFITPCRPTLLSPLVLRVTCPRGVEGRLNVTQTTCALSLSLSLSPFLFYRFSPFPPPPPPSWSSRSISKATRKKATESDTALTPCGNTCAT